MFGGPHHRVLSSPVELEWAGWRSDTHRLQQAGWEISVDQDIRMRGVQIAIRHKDFQIYGISSMLDLDYFRIAGDMQGFPRGLVLPIHYMASRITMQVPFGIGDGMMPIDATPQFITQEYRDLEDYRIFATPLARTDEIIVDPNDVSKLLDMIREVQLPEQEEIRARNKLRESREGQYIDAIPRQQFHAQILSIA